MNPHRFGAAVPRTCLSVANHSFALHALKNLLEACDSRWARLAGFGFPNDCFGLCFKLPGETELGSAEEQPNKG